MAERRAARWTGLLAAALCAIAAGLLVDLTGRELSGGSAARESYCVEDRDLNIEGGESLLQGLPHRRAFWSMPAYSVAHAAACRGLGGSALAAPAAAVWLDAALVFLAGALVAGPAGGGAAAVLFAATLKPDDAFGDRWPHVVTIILVALAAAWRARGARPLSAWLHAGAVALSWTTLSTLALYPALAAAPELLRRRWRQAAILVLFPAALLLPWMAANRASHGELVVFEHGRARTNIQTGAVGLVKTVSVEDAGVLSGKPAGPLAPWALREVAGHPGRFARALAARALFALRLHPALALLAVLGLVAGLRDPATRAVGLLAGYFLAVHCMMPVEARYFSPLWPLACVLSAGLLRPLLKPGDGAPAWPGAWEAALAAPAAAVLAGALLLSLSYPARSQTPDAMARQLARRPHDPWLWARKGRLLLEEGKPAQAEEALRRAVSLRPGHSAYYWLSVSRAAQGLPRLKPLAARSFDAEADWLRLEVMDEASHGRLDATREALRRAAAADEPRQLQAANLGPDPSVGARAAEAAAAQRDGRLFDLARLWPWPRRATALETLARLDGAAPHRERLRDFLLENIDLLVRAGRLSEARRLLALAERVPSNGSEARLASLYRLSGRAGSARAAVRRGLARLPGDPGLLFELALIAEAEGRAAEARRTLWRALKASPAVSDRRGIARAFQRLGAYDDALAALQPLEQLADAEWHNDRGVVMLLSGRRSAAEAELRASIRKGSRSLGPYLTLGSLLDGQGRVDEALAVYDAGLARRGIDEPKVRSLIESERLRLASR